MTGTDRAMTGLTTAEAAKLQEKYGKNLLAPEKSKGFAGKLFRVLREPMFLLLIAAAVLYFILGEPGDGAVMLVFVLVMIGIDAVQEWKTDRTLEALKELSSPRVTVIRDGEEQVVNGEELVPGDLTVLYEGDRVPADGVIVKCSDFRVDESTLTGETQQIWKTQQSDETQQGDGIQQDDETQQRKEFQESGEPEAGRESDGYWRRDYCYAGTLVTQGSAFVLIEKTGQSTEYGKVGMSVAAAPEEPSPLQRQTGTLVKYCAILAAVLFAMVTALTYVNLSGSTAADRITGSILSGVTLAMAMIPEEFPVVLTVFLSMGAWRLARKNSLVRKLPAVETLGSVSVLCVDKTGTLTENRMAVSGLWAADGGTKALLMMAGLGCEPDTYDPMETALLRCLEEGGTGREELFSGELIREYAFTNQKKMMGHVWKRNGGLLIAAKGCPEQIFTLCGMEREEEDNVLLNSREMAEQGLRVIAVAFAQPETEQEIPESLTDCQLRLSGLIGFSDPPRAGVRHEMKACQAAGIRVVMITGDDRITAAAIARQTGMADGGEIITGAELDTMSDCELCQRVERASVFARVIPEHKMRIVKALKENGTIVAMTGDGVNDAPALKYADIGIAMGKRGSEAAREAADLVLLDDNFSTIVETVKDGRRIYDNIRRAVEYIFTIHIPIALSALLAPVLGILPGDAFLLPVHIVLMELVIDPTCSILLERQPADPDIMGRGPKRRGEMLVTAGGMAKSAAQGLAVWAAAFGAYYNLWRSGPHSAPEARAMGITVLILSNLLLVLVNSAGCRPVIHSLGRLLKDRVMQAASAVTVLIPAVILYTPLCEKLDLAPLSPLKFLTAYAVSFLAVLWYEGIKLLHCHREK